MNEYNLPEILKNLEESEYKRRTKYRNLYIKLIERCKSMTKDELSGYTEIHHILPKCMGGKDVDSNYVVMPVRYHIMAHYILTKVYPDNEKIVMTMFIFSTRSELKKNFSTRTIADMREAASRAKSISMLGRKNPHKGVKHSKETKKKIGESELGEKHHNFGKNYSDEFRQILSKSHLNSNYKISDETREKLSKTQKGIKKPKYKYIDEDGNIYNKMIDLCNKFNYCRDTVRNNLQRYGIYKGIKYYKK